LFTFNKISMFILFERVVHPSGLEPPTPTMSR
jgi:hypothetical protein